MADEQHTDVTDRAEVVPDAGNGSEEEERRESIEAPSKIMRIGSMIKQLLEEVRAADLDEASRDRMREIYDHSISELATTLSPDLRDELSRVALPFGDEDIPSESELRVAHAQLVGWLEGLFQGIQATMFAQQMSAQQQLERMRGQLPPGSGIPGAAPNTEARPGTYL